MKIDYPSQEEIQIQCKQILDNSLPKPMSFCEKIRKIYWEPGLPTIFYHCGSAWFITGMVYLLVSMVCFLAWKQAKYQLFFSLLCCPLLYLVFSFAAFYMEEQTCIIELKKTLRYSFLRIISLRMLYTSMAAVLSDIMLLWGLQRHPAAKNFSAGEFMTIGTMGISSMFLFALLSLYLYYKLGSHGHLRILLMIWILVCSGILLTEDNISYHLFHHIPFAVHTAIVTCSMIAFFIYIGHISKKTDPMLLDR